MRYHGLCAKPDRRSSKTAMSTPRAGVPVLSKIPLIGRLFSNRSKVRDQKILLILVKPTILLQEEREKEAIAAMEGGS